jgi:hypothetical protein
LSSKPDSNRITKSGVFDVEKRIWVLDTLNYSIQDGYSKNYFIFNSIKNKKYGVFDSAGKIVVPLVYDDLIKVENSEDLFIIKKEKKYSFLNVKNNKKGPVYEYLADAHIDVKMKDKGNKTPIFIAKSNGKWGIIDSNDRILRPFTADYAAIMTDMRNALPKTVFLIEKEKVHAFNRNSFPRETSLLPLFQSERLLFMAHLVEDYHTIFFFKTDGQVLIPPQYKLSKKGYFIIDGDEQNRVYWDISNDKKRRKIVFPMTGKAIDFPFDFDIESASPSDKIIVVKNNKDKKNPNRYGVVDTSGHPLTLCDNYAVAIAEGSKGIYFVKHDTPKEIEEMDRTIRIGVDTLTEADKNWMLYNEKGVLLNKTPFNYPFAFNGDLGIGMQNNNFNLFKTNGEVFESNNKKIQYKNIRRDDETGFYYLFQNQGLTTTVSIKKRDGQPLLDNGRYDGAGIFYGKYALVSLAGKIGLIDSFGREIIAPQDLRTFDKGNFMDSLDIKNKILRKQVDSSEYEYSSEYMRLVSKIRPLPFHLNQNFGDIVNPDSLDINPNLRNTLWHLLLDKMLDYAIWQVGNIYYDRVNYFADKKLTYLDKNKYKEFDIISSIKATDKTFSFALRNASEIYRFHSLYLKNNRWNDLQINDLLQIQGEKRWKFNELLTRKIKALKDEEIDCSNTSAFVAQVENRFMLTKTGVDFCFDSQKQGRQFAIISLTWAELEGFLKTDGQRR